MENRFFGFVDINDEAPAILIMTFDLPKLSNFERRHRLLKDRYCGYSQ